MKTTKDLLTITTVALGTATLTVATLWSPPLEAGAEADAPLAAVVHSRLATHGVELSLAPAGGKRFKAGDEPEFELTAVNTNLQPASFVLTAVMTATSPAAPFSRMISVPTLVWEQQQMVILQPLETKVYPLTARTNLPPNKSFLVSLRAPAPKDAATGASVLALSFSTAVPTNTPSLPVLTKAHLSAAVLP